MSHHSRSSTYRPQRRVGAGGQVAFAFGGGERRIEAVGVEVVEPDLGAAGSQCGDGPVANHTHERRPRADGSTRRGRGSSQVRHRPFDVGGEVRALGVGRRVDPVQAEPSGAGANPAAHAQRPGQDPSPVVVRSAGRTCAASRTWRCRRSCCTLPSAGLTLPVRSSKRNETPGTITRSSQPLRIAGRRAPPRRVHEHERPRTLDDVGVPRHERIADGRLAVVGVAFLGRHRHPEPVGVEVEHLDVVAGGAQTRHGTRREVAAVAVGTRVGDDDGDEHRSTARSVAGGFGVGRHRAGGSTGRLDGRVRVACGRGNAASSAG